MIPVNLELGSGAVVVTREVMLAVGDAALKGSAILLVCAVTTLLMRRASAAARHLVWTIGVIGALIVPPLALVLPAWRISLPVPAIVRAVSDAAPQRVAIALETEAEVAAMTDMIAHASESQPRAHEPKNPRALPATTPAPPATIARAWLPTLFLVWLGGALLSLSGLLFSMVRVRRLQAGSVAVETGPCVSAIHCAAQRVGLQRVPRLHVGNERMMPMVWGLFRPVLLLPSGAARWSQPKLESVLLHELAHICRRDALTQFAAEIARAIYWFNPLVWLAARQLYLEREHACDDIVLNAGTRASDYAGELLDLVKSLRTTRATAMAAIAMARPSQLKVRLSAVLDEARPRHALTRRFVSIAAGIAVVVVPALAAMHPFEKASATGNPPILSSDLARASLASPKGNSRGPGPEATQSAGPAFAALSKAAPSASEQQGTCWRPEGKNTSISHNSDTDEEYEVIKWTSGRCSGLVRMEGKIRFNDDFTAIESISSGGLFRIEEDDGDTDRRLIVRNTGGQLVYQYRIDGRDHDFDAAGRAWLSQALLSMMRSTGFAADQRVDQLLRTQGVNGVLTEVQTLRSDYVQKIYLSRLFERTELSPAQVKSALEVASREIDSDYELGQVLKAMSKKYKFDDGTRQAFIAATNSIDSDYEQRQVLSTALANEQLNSQDVTAMLGAARNISSDYERSQLLMGLAQKYKLQPAMRQAYLEAAKDISSDYEKRRVFQHLLQQGALAPAELANLLSYASGISSDYEKSQILMELSKYDLSDPALQRAYLTATANMSSDYEHGRVLTSLLSKEKLSDTNLDLVLKSAAEINSDYELSQILTQVLQNHTLNEQQRAAFMKALNSIESSYEYGKVAALLLRQTK